MSDFQVHKFSKKCLESSAAFAKAAELISLGAHQGPVISIPSSPTILKDMLSKLMEAISRAQETVLEESINELWNYSLSLLPEKKEEIANLENLFLELRQLSKAAFLLEHLTPLSRDRISALAYKISSEVLLFHLRQKGAKASILYADEFLLCQGKPSKALPIKNQSASKITNLIKESLNSNNILLVTGAIGKASDGSTLCMGKGGADISAAFLAWVLKAKKITLWGLNPGIYSAHPELVEKVKPLKHLHYSELSELSFYGTSVLPKRAILHADEGNIAVHVKSVKSPEDQGTLIDSQVLTQSHPVKAVSCIKDQCLISVEGKGMAGVLGVAARVFKSLSSQGINITMISQSSSESSICMAIPFEGANRAKEGLEAEFELEISKGEIDKVSLSKKVGIIAIVGLGMAQTKGIAGRMCVSLGKAEVNIIAIAQGSSELNISIAVFDEDIKAALGGIHREFGLHLLDTGEDTRQRLNIILVGLGKVGRMFCELFLTKGISRIEDLSLQPRLIGLCDRSGSLFDANGIGQQKLKKCLSFKVEGGKIAQVEGANAGLNPKQLIELASQYRLGRTVIVDVTDSAESAELFIKAAEAGMDVSSANKIPFAGDLKQFNAIEKARKASDTLIKKEATVGAGLPVIDSLQMLLATGDQVFSVQGCFSGTLGYILSALENGSSFSAALKDAVENGFTEPDPYADLSGADVARKAIILGRVSGLVKSLDHVNLSGLVDESFAGLKVEKFLEKSKELDSFFNEKLKSARAQNKALRYTAKVEKNNIKVGLSEVPMDSALGGLKGTDNMVVFKSERYDDRPLVICGPGAGVEVTAMGVLTDLLRIASERS